MFGVTLHEREEGSGWITPLTKQPASETRDGPE